MVNRLPRRMMADIELPPGFLLVRGWAAQTRLEDVVHDIDWRQQTIRIYGREVLQPRLTCWMGDAAYTYSGRRHEPSPMPQSVAYLRARLNAMSSDVQPAGFNSVLANLYRHGGDSVSWHADDEPELGAEPVIASLSLGAARVFQVRRNADNERWAMLLEHGDLLVMSGRSQLDYQHCVPKSARAGSQRPRVNLTFRRITD